MRLLPGLDGEEVEPDDLPGERDPRPGGVGEGRFESGGGGPRPGSGLPPEVRLPGEAERQPVRGVLGGGDLPFREAGDRQADEVPPLGERRSPGLHLRIEAAESRLGVRRRPRQPRRRPPERQVPVERPRHHPVEFRRPERGPPVRRRGFDLGSDPRGQRRRRQFRVRSGGRRPQRAPGSAAAEREAEDGERTGRSHELVSDSTAESGGVRPRRGGDRRARWRPSSTVAPRWLPRRARPPDLSRIGFAGDSGKSKTRTGEAPTGAGRRRRSRPRTVVRGRRRPGRTQPTEGGRRGVRARRPEVSPEAGRRERSDRGPVRAAPGGNADDRPRRTG